MYLLFFPFHSEETTWDSGIIHNQGVYRKMQLDQQANPVHFKLSFTNEQTA